MIRLKRRFNEAVSADNPNRCLGTGYRIKLAGNRLACASFVSRGLRYPDLGFNIVEPYVGPGTMADTHLALMFLTKEDAEAFCKRYNLDLVDIYVARNVQALVRAADIDIPVYVDDAAYEYANHPTAFLTANHNAPLQSIQDVASDDLKTIVAKKRNDLEIVDRLYEIAKNIRTRLLVEFQKTYSISYRNYNSEIALDILSPKKTRTDVEFCFTMLPDIHSPEVYCPAGLFDKVAEKLYNFPEVDNVTVPRAGFIRVEKDNYVVTAAYRYSNEFVIGINTGSVTIKSFKQLAEKNNYSADAIYDYIRDLIRNNLDMMIAAKKLSIDITYYIKDAISEELKKITTFSIDDME